MVRLRSLSWFALACIAVLPARHAAAQAFTYQGVLSQSGAPVSGTYDLRFQLWNALSGGAQVGGDVNKPGLALANGMINVSLDFGPSAFDGNPRWLAVQIVTNGGATVTTLLPRQAITPVPYALQTRGLTVDASGNLGIGTTAPAKRLTVAGSMEIGVHTADYQHLRIGGGNSSGFLYGSFPHFGDGIHMGYNYYANGAGANQIINPGGGTSRLSMVYGAVVLATNSAAGGEPFNRMIVTENGDVGIGTMGPTSRLHVQGNIQGEHPTSVGVLGVTYGTFGSAQSVGVSGVSEATTGGGIGVRGRSDSTSGFDFYAYGAGANYGAESSRRWKRNIELIPDPLAMLDQLRGVYFDWDADHGGHHDVGMIAEEVGAVLPEIVQYEDNGLDAIGMDYSKMTPLLVEAVKALRSEKDAEIERLSAENQRLKESLRALERRLARLEAAN